MAKITINISKNQSIKQLRTKQQDMLRTLVIIERRIEELENKRR